MFRRWPGVLSLVAGLWLVGAEPAWASSPTTTLETFFARANALLRAASPVRGLEAPRQSIRELVNEVIAVREAAALALGPAWDSQVKEDRDEFVRLFGTVLERGFVAAIVTKANVSGGVKIQYLGESITGDSALVETSLLGKTGSELPVDFRLVRRGEGWKVQDVTIDGVSLIANYRAQFNRVLRDYHYVGLLAKMRGEAPDPIQVAVDATVTEAGPGPNWVMGREEVQDPRLVPDLRLVPEPRPTWRIQPPPETQPVGQGHD